MSKKIIRKKKKQKNKVNLVLKGKKVKKHHPNPNSKIIICLKM